MAKRDEVTDQTEGARIAALARCMAAAKSAADASPGHVMTCGAIDRVWGYLDVLDRKAASLVTLNSFLLALVGLFVLRNTAAGAPAWLEHLRLIAGSLGALISVVAIAAAIFVFRINWRYMHHAQGIVDGFEFDAELVAISRVAARRQRLIWWIWSGTIFALAATLVGITLSMWRTI